MRHKYTLFRRKGQKVWYFYYYEGDKRIARSTGKTLKYEAAQYIEEFFNEDGRQNLTLKEYAANFYLWDKCEWIKRQHAKGKSFAISMANARRAHLQNYLFPTFGHLDLSKINPIDVENWLVNLPLANGTKNAILYSLNIILREAKRDKVITSNPLDDVEPLAAQYKPRDVFTLEELKILFPLDQTELLQIWRSRNWATLFNVMASTGIRAGEVRALRWEDVLWELKGLLIMRAVKADGQIGEPKAREIRPIFLPDRTCQLLDEWKAETLYDEPRQLIFPGEGPDKPYNKHTLLDHFRAALDEAEIDTTGRNLVVHSFRHTYNTIMREVLPEKMLREFTGHRSEKMTDRYDHPALENRLKRMRESQHLIEGVWNPARS